MMIEQPLFPARPAAWSASQAQREGGQSFVTGKGGTSRLSSGWGSLSENTGDREESPFSSSHY